MQKKSSDYPVEFTQNLFDGENPTLADTLAGVFGRKPRIFLAADQNVIFRHPDLGRQIGAYVRRHGLELVGEPAVVAGGEKCKADDMRSVNRMFSLALSSKIGRGDAVLAIGGGSLLDLTGYATVQVRGGASVVRVPTTPAAMVDAASASDARVDNGGFKDALSVPCVPAAVLIDPNLAGTVVDGVWRGGIVEAVRLAAVSDASFLKAVTETAAVYARREPEALMTLVRGAWDVRRKKGPTSFALWSAHRLEAMSEYRLPHGYAVAVGIAIDLAYAQAKDCLKPAAAAAILAPLVTCNALEPIANSRHLLARDDSLLRGLDVWRLYTGSDAVELPSGIGRRRVDELPDRQAYKAVFAALAQRDNPLAPRPDGADMI